MRSPLAFLASLGASAALVAAIAVSLLTFSTVVALQGWPGLGEEEAGAQSALVVDGAVREPAGPQSRRAARRDSVVLRAPARPAARRVQQAEEARVRPTRPAVGPRATNLTGSRLPAISSPPPASGDASREPSPQAQGGAPTRSAPPRTGDAVRKVGDDLSGGVQGAGEALNGVAAPLSPVVGQTLEELTKLIAALLRNTTNIVGAALDRLTQSR